MKRKRVYRKRNYKAWITLGLGYIIFFALSCLTFGSMIGIKILGGLCVVGILALLGWVATLIIDDVGTMFYQIGLVIEDRRQDKINSKN